MFYSRGEEGPNGAYLINPSTTPYPFTPGGSPASLLPTDQGADAVAAELARWVR